MKSIVFLILISIFSSFLVGCSHKLETISINTAPKNIKDDYRKKKIVIVLGDVKIPGTKIRKVDHSYQVGIKIDALIDSKKFLDKRPSDAIIKSEVEKNDGQYETIIFTDDFDSLKKWLSEN